MTKLLNIQEFAFLSDDERDYMSRIASTYGGFPTIEQMWKLMDEPWTDLKCDPYFMDNRIDRYYRHPVWLLNGLFIEQHKQSINNRELFTKWVAAQRPKRIADYGGGFGGLARMIAEVCPSTTVEIIEPYPHPLAIRRAMQTANVSYAPRLTGTYDLLIATDVFEHVPDPLALVAESGRSLKKGGGYLIANCFEPVILCHLPQTFHFRYSWNQSLAALGFELSSRVCYGRAYTLKNRLDLPAARRIEKRSKKIWPVLQPLSRRIALPLSRLLIR